MSDQPIRTLLHNQVILGHPDSQREKPSQDRNRPLTNQNTGQHQKDPGIEDPIRQHPNTSIPETERKDDRDEDSEDDQRPRAAISPQPRCSVPSKPRNQHCSEQFTRNPDEVGSVEQNKPKTRGEYRQGQADRPRALCESIESYSKEIKSSNGWSVLLCRSGKRLRTMPTGQTIIARYRLR